MPDLPTPDSIRTEAAAVGLSIAELCRRASVSPSVYFRWVQGTGPRITTVAKWQAVIRGAAGASCSKGASDAKEAQG